MRSSAIQLGFLAAEFLHRGFGLFLEARLASVDVVEAARDLAREFDVRHLVLAHRHLRGAVDQDIRALQQRITEEAVGGEILVGQFFLLVLVGRHAFQPAQRRDHGQQQVQFGMFRHARLDEQRGLRRIDACGQPVDDHVPHALLDDLRRVVMRGQRMPVGHEKQALVLVLHFHPVLQYTMVMPQVQTARGAHSG